MISGTVTQGPFRQKVIVEGFQYEATPRAVFLPLKGYSQLTNQVIGIVKSWRSMPIVRLVGREYS